jgi:hypothetical protein
MRQEQISRKDISNRRVASTKRRDAAGPQAALHGVGGPDLDLDEELLRRIEIVLATAADTGS